MDDLFVLLTVPHDRCPPVQPKKSHLCDTLAKTTAFEMNEFLKLAGIDSKVLIATIHRSREQGGRDQNRDEGKGSEFRRDIEQLTTAKLRSGKITFVIDMHSFSDLTTTFGSGQVVIMDPVDHARSPRTSYVEDLMHFFETKSESEPPGYVRGGDQNSIVVDARKAGAISFLVETRESSTRAQRGQKGTTLTEWISDYSEKEKKTAVAISW